MKLIDLLVQELPKRGGWPEGYEVVSTNGYGAVWAYKTKGCTAGRELYFHSTTEGHVTREQYEAALSASKEMITNKPGSDGWISWRGGECPVDGDVVVDVKFRAQGQADLDGDIADNFRWEHFSNGADVVAYRLHKSEHQKPQWDGEGTPPVGCECEFFDCEKWFKVTMMYGGSHLVVLFDHDNQIERSFSTSRIYGKFRPIRSEADKKRDAAVVELSSVIDYRNGCSSKPLAGWLYDAIAAGKIPGIRIE